MSELFRGHVVKLWFDTDMRSDVHRSLNKIVVRKCVEFYYKCWKHRNEAHHDAEKQKIRIRKWLVNKREMARNSVNLQVREHAKKFEIDEENSDIEKMKKWILNLKKMKTKVEKVPRMDIRNYMLQMCELMQKVIELGS